MFVPPGIQLRYAFSDVSAIVQTDDISRDTPVRPPDLPAIAPARRLRPTRPRLALTRCRSASSATMFATSDTERAGWPAPRRRCTASRRPSRRSSRSRRSSACRRSRRVPSARPSLTRPVRERDETQLARFMAMLSSALTEAAKARHLRRLLLPCARVPPLGAHPRLHDGPRHSRALRVRHRPSQRGDAARHHPPPAAPHQAVQADAHLRARSLPAPHAEGIFARSTSSTPT